MPSERETLGAIQSDVYLDSISYVDVVALIIGLIATQGPPALGVAVIATAAALSLGEANNSINKECR